MFKNWLAFGMSAYNTPGFQDTSRLMTRGFDGEVVYVEPPQSLLRWRNANALMWDWQPREHDAHHTVLTPPLSIPKKLDIFSLGLKRQASNLNTELSYRWGHEWRKETVVYVTNWTPYQYRLIECLNPTYLVFDCVDDVLAFPYDWNRDKVIEAWKRIANRASSVLAVSPTLRDQMETQLNRSVTLMPNGVDAQLFMKPASAVPPALELAGDKLRVGFAGTLNHWINFEAMLTLVEDFPEVTLFLLGRQGQMAEQQAQTFKRLLDHDRVHYLGGVPYEELPGYLQAQDVLILPRIASSASEASNPLKLFEYLAVGKPTVVGGVPIAQDLNRLVYGAETSLSYQDAFRRALDELRNPSPGIVRERQAYAMRRTWSERVRSTLRAIQTT
ncbi:glycosyltransferase [Alicyclobacillus dauci]|uniref:Glycosyltransferase n=1 Tax=Alicyclobacillus dauci TaxID=1475485 RepID=A0ABY6Z0S8_9BACL|nr:glycosyltransferase [Alicyclobacillus dauci]WAH36138.1 glycosyltransferase [Alicyclobacillus dauci]